MNPVGYYAEAVPLQVWQYSRPPGQPGVSTAVQYTAVNVTSEPPPDNIIWSLFSLVYSNPFCLGLVALICSIKSRDQKMIGDLEGARKHDSAACCFNTVATTLTSVALVITIVTLCMLT